MMPGWGAPDLQQHRYEGFDFQDLSALLHEKVIIFEANVKEFSPFQSCVGTCHGDNFRLFRLKVLDTVRLPLKFHCTVSLQPKFVKAVFQRRGWSEC